MTCKACGKPQPLADEHPKDEERTYWDLQELCDENCADAWNEHKKQMVIEEKEEAKRSRIEPDLESLREK